MAVPVLGSTCGGHADSGNLVQVSKLGGRYPHPPSHLAWLRPSLSSRNNLEECFLTKSSGCFLKFLHMISISLDFLLSPRGRILTFLTVLPVIWNYFVIILDCFFFLGTSFGVSCDSRCLTSLQVYQLPFLDRFLSPKSSLTHVCLIIQAFYFFSPSLFLVYICHHFKGKLYCQLKPMDQGWEPYNKHVLVSFCCYNKIHQAGNS